MVFKSGLTKAEQEKAQNELNEDPATINEKLKSLGAILVIDWPEVFGDLKWTPEIEKVFDSGVMELLEPEDDGCWVLTSASGRWDPAEIPAHALHQEKGFKLKRDADVHGIRFIIDHGGMSWSRFRAVGLKSAKMGGRFDACSPFRNKRSFVLNCPGWLETVFNIVKKFFSKKTLERVVILPKGADWEELYKEVPKERLPEYLGGTAPSCEQAWIKDLKANSKRIEKKFEFMKALCDPNFVPETDETDNELSEEMAKLEVEAKKGTLF
ncbi:Oidioi.mRNA.OKI2018_I69.XSR.g14897.t1.cds [Oikopleura dioica]|uniref:Oidioi.mRNA.OKI2018_I69.XSR.g14897.t1.cds n=1 Tax=Oikopleura dioica TaxID=34765 RepID=A0ABN7SGB0_OIKDI|nr:Oidioi.mRNA.OKI2018_I69.XSR.g14897.t1.cds [Oikopleura dioica]